MKDKMGKHENSGASCFIPLGWRMGQKAPNRLGGGQVLASYQNVGDIGRGEVSSSGSQSSCESHSVSEDGPWALVQGDLAEATHPRRRASCCGTRRHGLPAGHHPSPCQAGPLTRTSRRHRKCLRRGRNPGAPV